MDVSDRSFSGKTGVSMMYGKNRGFSAAYSLFMWFGLLAAIMISGYVNNEDMSLVNWTGAWLLVCSIFVVTIALGPYQADWRFKWVFKKAWMYDPLMRLVEEQQDLHREYLALYDLWEARKSQPGTSEELNNLYQEACVTYRRNAARYTHKRDQFVAKVEEILGKYAHRVWNLLPGPPTPLS